MKFLGLLAAGAAFLAFAIMVFLFAGSLFYMDKVRRRREDQQN